MVIKAKPADRKLAIPLDVKNDCLAAMRRAIPSIAQIALEGKTESVRLSAFDKLGKYGFGGRKVVVVEAPMILDIAAKVNAEVFDFGPAQEARFIECLIAELEALGDEFEFPLEEESDAGSGAA